MSGIIILKKNQIDLGIQWLRHPLDELDSVIRITNDGWKPPISATFGLPEGQTVPTWPKLESFLKNSLTVYLPYIK